MGFLDTLLGPKCEHGNRGQLGKCPLCEEEASKRREAMRQERIEKNQRERRAAAVAEANAEQSARQRLAHISEIQKLSGVGFESLMLDVYRQLGYHASETPRTNDGGIDGVLRKDGKNIVLQCKNWRKARVGSPEMRDFFGAFVSSGAATGIMCTTGSFSSEARTWCKDKPIELIDGDEVLTMVTRYFAQGGKVPKVVYDALIETDGRERLNAEIRMKEGSVCQQCGGKMTLRKGRYGPFLGCNRYPQCRNTMDLETLVKNQSAYQKRRRIRRTR